MFILLAHSVTYTSLLYAFTYMFLCRSTEAQLPVPFILSITVKIGTRFRCELCIPHTGTRKIPCNIIGN